MLVLRGYAWCLPGITEIVFKALSTLNVRRADTLPRATNSVTYLQGHTQLIQEHSTTHNEETTSNILFYTYTIFFSSFSDAFLQVIKVSYSKG